MLLNSLTFIGIFLEVILIFNLMIVVHELGHFLVAKWRGLTIEAFGIWFGKSIWEKKINGVTYSLGTIPFGGFVKLPQLASMEAFEGKSEFANLKPAPVWDKVLVAIAGPAFSLGLAFALATLVYFVGRPVSESQTTTTIGYVLPDSPASRAGLQAGDKVLEVDGKRVDKFSGASDSIQWEVIRSEGKTVPFKIERMVNGKPVVMTIDTEPIVPQTKGWARKGLRQVEIEPAETPMVGKVDPDSDAAKAGLKPNDLITAVNGVKLYSSDGIYDASKSHPDQPLTLTVERKGSPGFTASFEPEGARIKEVAKDSPAEQAGLQAGDIITAVDGQRVRYYSYITDYVQSHGTDTILLTVKGKGDVRVKPVLPEEEEKPRIGIVWDNTDITWDATGQYTLDHPTPFDQVKESVSTVVNTVGALISPKSDVKAQHLSGPVMIFRIYYVLIQSTQGLRLVLWFSVFLNVNLALLNMLPMPVLDGGHILLSLIEAVRRKPGNVRVLEIVQGTCAALIITYMLYVTFYDVMDLLPKDAGMKFRPAAGETR